MGDPRRQRKKYSGPFQMWEKGRIEEEKKVLKDYGLKNKKEIWRASSKLKSITSQAKKLMASNTEQSKKEREQLLKKLHKLSLVSSGASLDDVLGITLSNVLDRRLQTVMVKKGVARSVGQARQMITHNHVSVGGKNITSPSYMVQMEEEGQILFSGSSSFSDSSHPERNLPEPKPKEKRKERPDARRRGRRQDSGVERHARRGRAPNAGSSEKTGVKA